MGNCCEKTNCKYLNCCWYCSCVNLGNLAPGGRGGYCTGWGGSDCDDGGYDWGGSVKLGTKLGGWGK